MAAKALEISMLDLQAQMKKGLVKPSELVPKLIAIYRKAAQKGLKESLATFESYKTRFINSAQEFANVIYRNGLENFARVGFTALKQWLILLKPIGREIGHIFDGLSDVLYTVQYVIALTMDWMTYLGWLNDKTDETKDSMISVGQVIGWVFGIGILTKFMKGLFGLKWAFNMLAKLFRGPALAESLAGGLASMGAEGGAAAGAISAAGTSLGMMFGTAFLAAWGVFVYKIASSLGAEDLGKKLGNFMYDWDQNKTRPTTPEQVMLDVAAKKRASYTPSLYGSTGYGAGAGMQQTTPRQELVLDIKVKGDAVDQHFTKQLSNVFPHY